MPVPRLASRPSQGRHPIPWGVPRGFSWDCVTVQSLRVSDQFSLRHALPAQAYAPLRSPGAAKYQMVSCCPLVSSTTRPLVRSTMRSRTPVGSNSPFDTLLRLEILGAHRLGLGAH